MSLIAHYKLDGLAASIGQDLTYFNNSGKLVPADGKFGTAYQRMGLNDGADYFGTTEDIHLSSSFTMSCWAYVTSAEPSANGLVTNHDHSTNTGAGITVKYISPTDFRISCNTGTGTSRTYNSYYGTSNIKDRWSHLLLRFDASTNNLSLWVDGVEEFSMAYAMKCVPDKLRLFKWSTSHDSPNYRPGAIIDDVRIYDHALSEREVRDLSQGLVLHYTFDQFQEPTENKVTSHIPVWGAWAGFTGTSVTFSEGNISGIKLTGTASGGVCWSESNYIQALPSTTYTVSAIMKWLGTYSSPNFFYLRQYNSAGAQVEERGVFLATGLSSGQWHPVSETFTTRSDCASFIIHGYQYIAPCEIWCGNLQVEQKSYATPFVNGTRAGIVRDQSTQGNDAPLALANTPKWVEGGMVGKGCYEFAGNGKTPGILSPQIKTDKYTISFWAKHTSAGKIAFGSGRSAAFYWYGDYSWKYMHGGISGEFYYPKSQTINIGEWGHFAVTYDGSNVRIYRNGVYEGVKASSGIPNFDRHSIGYGYADTSYDFQGQIDDVRIYTTALSADEVKELYEQRASLDSRGNFYSSLISNSVGYQKVWGDGTGIGFTTYGIDESSVSTNGVLRFTTSINDPMINMYNIGSFDPNVYKYIQVKYRVVSGNAGDVEIFFTNTQYTAVNAAQRSGATLNSDGNWNVVTVTMHTHPKWTNSNITGWRFDMGTVSGVTIEVEWIRLVSDTGALSVKSNKVVGNFSEVGITNGLVAYYPLNKDAKDYSGNGYHGTVTGAVLTGGGFDGKGAYRFDGVNNNFIRASHEPMNPTAHTISGWFKKRSDVKTSYPIFLSYSLPYIACDGAGHSFRVSYTGGGIQTNTAGGVVPVLNKWYYVAAVFDVGGVSLFVNGEFQAINPTPCVNVSTTFDMGRHIDTPAYQIDGEICNIKIFNRALTPEEIAVEYKRTGVSKMTQHNGTVYIQGQVKETI